jgi:PBSX family phage portal protein
MEMTDLVKAYVVGGGEGGRSQQLPESAWSEAYATGEVVQPPYDLDSLASLYELNGTHKACVDAKTVNIVGLGHRFVPLGNEREASPENLAVLEHLFATCNPDMTFTEVMRAVWTDVECIGNGYLELTRNSRGQIDGMYHVPGTTVRVKSDRHGFVQERDGQRRHFRTVGSWEHTDPETGSVQNELVHFAKYTPLSSYYGVPDILPAVAAVLGDKAAREYNVDFFTHNAVPRMAIIVEGGQLSDEVLGQLKQFMESEVKGQGHKTLVLDVPGRETKVRLEKLTVGSQDDAAFLDYRKANRDEVLLVHRVPPSKVTVVENANLANSRDQDKTFREQVVRPEQRRIEYRFNRLIAEQFGIGDWAFRFRELDLAEAKEEAEVAALYAGIGALTVDEIRGQMGLAPL